jgi:hypothetical protein
VQRLSRDSASERVLKMSKDWIQTFTGRKFYPLAPRQEDFDIQDIARALSMLCRYNGHVARFYSVAEHSVRISWLAEEHAAAARFGAATVVNIARWGLMHDASEAYLADIPRPLKHQPAMAPYRAAEKHMQAAVAQWAGLVGDEPAIVSALDTQILGTEAFQLKQPIHPDWGATTATGQLPAPLDLGPIGWESSLAEHRFLLRWKILDARR